ncbi:MAG: carboxypeptidase, partial [Actinobacteria bacterium]|nr:carboxypeptidase [Actinomycetota bacterium]
MTYNFDRFLRYDEMVSWLQDLAARFPHLVALETYGKSHKGRDLWIATVTDSTTGSHDSKPAHWIDANIHATEVTGGVAALYILEYLANQFGRDHHTTEALRTRTFYIVPRVNPDGVEDALLDRPLYHRSSVR